MQFYIVVVVYISVSFSRHASWCHNLEFDRFFRTPPLVSDDSAYGTAVRAASRNREALGLRSKLQGGTAFTLLVPVREGEVVAFKGGTW